MSLQRRPKDTDVSSQASIISPLNPKPNKNKNKSSLVTNLEKKGSEDKDKDDHLLFDWQGPEKNGDSSHNPFYDWYDPEMETESPIRYGDGFEKKCLEDKFSGDKEHKKEIDVINLGSEEDKGLGSKVKVDQKKDCVNNADEEDSSINPDFDFNVDVDDQAVYDYVVRNRGDGKETLASCNGLMLERKSAKSLAQRKWLSDAVLTMCATYLQHKSKSKHGEDIFFNTYTSRKIRAFLEFDKPKGISPTLRCLHLLGIVECLLDCKKVSLQFLFGLGLSNIKAFSIMV